MRPLLQIGEIAQLLGITPKTVRHYEKVGLLAEPERSKAGYRLYSANHLLRIQRIRRFQALGLSLKQIKEILGNGGDERSLRSVLAALHDAVSAEIEQLEERRKRIARLLASESPPSLGEADELPAALKLVQEQLGEHLSEVSPELWEQDRKLFALLEDFQWPGNPQAGIEASVRYLAEHPEIYRTGLALAERLVALAHEPADSPEIDRLVVDCSAYLADNPELSAQPQATPTVDGPFAEALSELLAGQFTPSPAQQRFFEAMERHLAGTDAEAEQQE